jgi:hypothetical protein
LGFPLFILNPPSSGFIEIFKEGFTVDFEGDGKV